MDNDQILIEQFIHNHSKLAIQTIEEFEIEEIALLVENLSQDQSIDILSRLAAYKSGKIIEKISLEAAARIIDRLPLSKADSILRISNEIVRNQLLDGMQSENANHLKRALSFSSNQVGAYLEPFVLTLSPNEKIDDALKQVRNSNAVVKPQIFILNEDNKLVGYINLNELITSNPNRTIQSIQKPVPFSVFAEMTIGDLLETWNHSFTTLPVIRPNEEFLGTVSRESLREVQMTNESINNSAIKAGNALGDLFLIGLTGLLGISEMNTKT